MKEYDLTNCELKTCGIISIPLKRPRHRLVEVSLNMSKTRVNYDNQT